MKPESNICEVTTIIHSMGTYFDWWTSLDSPDGKSIIVNGGTTLHLSVDKSK